MPLEIERKLLVIEDGWRPQEPGTRLLEYAYPVPLQHAAELLERRVFDRSSKRPVTGSNTRAGSVQAPEIHGICNG